MDTTENKKITKYKNEINTIPMRRWNSDEMDLFFAILTKLRDEGVKDIIMDRDELESLANYSRYFNEFKDCLNSVKDRIKTLEYVEFVEENGKYSYTYMPLFTYFKVTWDDDFSDVRLEISVNEKFEYILNRWNEGNWTKFVLDEFTEIKSTYSKTLFRLLKQWRVCGKVEFKLADFRQLMDIPDSYPTGMITSRIVKNGVEDLKPYFDNLKVKVVKSNKRGTPVIGYCFTFNPEPAESYEYDYVFNKPNKSNKSLEKTTETTENKDIETILRQKLLNDMKKI